jgi:hypothetical protein
MRHGLPNGRVHEAHPLECVRSSMDAQVELGGAMTLHQRKDADRDLLANAAAGEERSGGRLNDSHCHTLPSSPRGRGLPSSQALKDHSAVPKDRSG